MMAEKRNYTVQDVKELFELTVIETFAATEEGQAHLNRIAKAITNESIDQRITTTRQTHATTAFDKEVAKVATMYPEKLEALIARKPVWIANYIDRKYGQEEV